MQSYNASFQESLEALYDYLGNMHLSLELIRALATHLRLDTYLDSDINSSAGEQAKRLSIAGTHLLADVDFASDHVVTNVTISIGSLPPQNTERRSESAAASLDGFQFFVGESVIDGVNIVTLDFRSESAPSFLGTLCLDAEKILYQSLSGNLLGSFPQNLRCLSQLNEELFCSGKLYTNIDRIAWFLASVHYTECLLNPSEDVRAGWTSRFGKVVFNDWDQSKIGVFLQIWRNGAFAELLGFKFKPYTALLNLADQALVDYHLEKAKEDQWHLLDEKMTERAYKFEFGPSPMAISSAAKGLVLSLQEPIYIPKQVLEYLDIHEDTSSQGLCNTAMKTLSEFGSVLFNREKESNTACPNISFSFEDISALVAVENINLHLLKQLSLIIPVFRNFLVFNALVESVNKTPYEVSVNKTTISDETCNKIRESLKLLSDVPTEELLGLSTFSTDYLNVPILQNTANLQEFVGEVSPHDTEKLENQFPSSSESLTFLKPALKFSVEDVWYDLPNTDLILSVAGLIGKEMISEKVQISNGVLRLRQSLIKSEPDAMDIDNETVRRSTVSTFFKALSLTNDILLSLQAVE